MQAAYFQNNLHVLEGTMSAERYIKVFRATYASPQMMCISGKDLCIFGRTMQNHTYCSYYNSMAS